MFDYVRSCCALRCIQAVFRQYDFEFCSRSRLEGKQGMLLAHHLVGHVDERGKWRGFRQDQAYTCFGSLYF